MLYHPETCTLFTTRADFSLTAGKSEILDHLILSRLGFLMQQNITWPLDLAPKYLCNHPLYSNQSVTSLSISENDTWQHISYFLVYIYLFASPVTHVTTTRYRRVYRFTLRLAWASTTPNSSFRLRSSSLSTSEMNTNYKTHRQP